MVLIHTWDTVPYTVMNLSLGYANILFVAQVITNHLHKKYRLTMVTSQPQPGFAISQQLLLLFWSRMSTIILINACSWCYAQINMGRKNHWVLLPERLWTQISDITKVRQSVNKSRAIFDLANSGLSLLPPLLKMGASGGICRSKKVSLLLFSIFHTELAWKPTYFVPSFPIQLEPCNNKLWKQ